jgi:hypothetical protein
VAAALCCVVTVVAAPRLLRGVLPDAEALARSDPLSIEGPCTPAEVQDYLADTGPRLERLLAGLDTIGQGPVGREHLSSIDLDALRGARAELAERGVAPCLTDLRDEEVALADAVIAEVEPLQGPGRPSAVQSAKALFSLVPAVRLRVERMKDARQRLEVRYQLTGAQGTAMPVFVPYPAPSSP